MSLVEIVRRFRYAHIMVVGDPIRDRYVFCKAPKLCPEAPVPILVPQYSEIRMGGALNVANQVAQFVNDFAIGVGPLEQCSVKTRYMVDGRIVSRVDEDQEYVMEPEDYAQLERMVEREDPNVIIVSDYGKGVVTATLMDTIRRTAPDAEIVVDPKGDSWAKYQGADVICPNSLELIECKYTLPFKTIIEKRGEHGIALLQRGESIKEFEAMAQDVYDVTGAGDVVVAIVGLTIAVGGDLEQACKLANLAAGVAVMEVGTAVCDAETLMALADEQE